MAGKPHFHGYGPWIGSRDAYGAEGRRRPGLEPGDMQTREFLASSLPPMQVRHWLMRKDQTARERTWTSAAEAVAWLRRVYEENPPFIRDDSGRAYLSLEDKATAALEALSRGSDAVWVYYTKASSLASFSVVCCPHRPFSTIDPIITCPLPPT
ncbi:hypothetical protein J7E93_34135 [Streptomyces sp. ISL-36]|uniref:hypothetical protein n=1 Tax=Streptomyces sp. ISL-36 TaxID=2819182 RepID=UPI001BEA74B1|nr:hypothetical protein [Streptomyces sp. ISL-36]MBT2445043.1 hypothetical protein [Streptomyces sp. ISL-36]